MQGKRDSRTDRTCWAILERLLGLGLVVGDGGFVGLEIPEYRTARLQHLGVDPRTRVRLSTINPQNRSRRGG